jgi:hypothetical protein
MTLSLRLLSFFALALLATPAGAQAERMYSADKAQMLYKHGLVEDAKREAIGVLFQPHHRSHATASKFLLARISLAEGRFGHAVELWSELVESDPESKLALESQVLLEQVRALNVQTDRSAVDNVRAATYFSAAEFWLGDLNEHQPIDVQAIPVEEAAAHWLEKIANEFPGTPAAELAMRDRARAFLGRPFDPTAGPGIGALCSLTNPRMLGAANAAVRNDRVQFWMKQAIEAVRDLESGFPGSAYLPQLKFLVADAYMRADQVSDAKLWLEAVYREAKAESFWSHIARLRLDR